MQSFELNVSGVTVLSKLYCYMCGKLLMFAKGDKLFCVVVIRTNSNTFGMYFRLKGVGIQCCKRSGVKDSLATRQNIRVNPFASRS